MALLKKTNGKTKTVGFAIRSPESNLIKKDGRPIFDPGSLHPH
jgi:hypothetical protein